MNASYHSSIENMCLPVLATKLRRNNISRIGDFVSFAKSWYDRQFEGSLYVYLLLVFVVACLAALGLLCGPGIRQYASSRQN